MIQTLKIPLWATLFLIGLSHLAASVILLLPYLFLPAGPTAILCSIQLTLLAPSVIGILKGKFASLPYLKSGIQVTHVGAASGIGGYFLGTLLPRIPGIG